MPLVSVVIPCYNDGEYLCEAVASVLSQTYDNLQMIIVNDGSTDSQTLMVLKEYALQGITVVTTPNRGLAAARNTGMLQAAGEYVLPLDSDDKIAPSYIEKGIAVLESEPNIGVVYSLADRFGVVSGLWNLPEFSPHRVLWENMVFCSAIFRRSVWESVGGYNTNMRHGWEDWDLWLSFVDHGIGFFRIPEVLFHYRVRSVSMTSTMSYWHKFIMLMRLISNHPGLYCKKMLRIR